MLKKTICPECGSHDIRVRAYIRVDLPMEDAQGEITKDTIVKDTTNVIDDGEYPVLKVYCGECHHELEYKVDLHNSEMFNNKSLTDELCKRVEELEDFKKQTLDNDFRQEIEEHDISSERYEEIGRKLGLNDEEPRTVEEGGYTWEI